MVRSVTNEITKKKYIKLISHYRYEVVLIILRIQKSEIYRVFLKVCVKIYYIYVCVCMCVCIKVKKKGIFQVFINLKTNEIPMVNN